MLRLHWIPGVIRTGEREILSYVVEARVVAGVRRVVVVDNRGQAAVASRGVGIAITSNTPFSIGCWTTTKLPAGCAGSEAVAPSTS